MTLFQKWFQKRAEELPRPLGVQGEEWAAEEYKKKGYAVVARNAFNTKGKRAGELDVVVTSDTKIIFVEVKTRTVGSERFGTGAEAVTRTKQRRIIRAAQLFLALHPEYAVLRPQIDVCVILVDPVDTNARSVTIMENSVDDLT